MKRHPIDVISLTAGILTVGAALLLMRPDADAQALWQFTPIGLVAFGLALLVSAVTRTRRSAPEPASAVDADRPASRADELTEEDLIRDSLGHFGADMVDGTLLFDREGDRTPDEPDHGVDAAADAGTASDDAHTGADTDDAHTGADSDEAVTTDER